MRRDPLTHRRERPQDSPRLRVRRPPPAAPRKLWLSLCSSTGPDGRAWPSWVPTADPQPLVTCPAEPRIADGRVVAEFHDGERRYPAVTTDGERTTFHFDPWATARAAHLERHVPRRRALATRLPVSLFRLPGPLRLRGLGLLERFGGLRSARVDVPFPRFPREGALELMRLLVQHALGRPIDPPWPRHRPVTVLTHDVDTAAGQRCMATVAREEERLGLRSCWFVVGDRYPVDHGLLDDLRAAGHEIGLHGARHDFRLSYLPDGAIARRLDRCLEFVERHQVVGFRSPALLMSDGLATALACRFNYDSSVPDTDVRGLAGARRGCASVFPFWRGELLELPPTLPLDDRLVLLGQTPKEVQATWTAKLAWIRRVGGMGLVSTHTEPHLGGGGELLGAYRGLLAELAQGEQEVCLPRDVARWWRDGDQET